MQRKDTSTIPAGGHCYQVVPIKEGEILSTDIERFGKDLREYRYHGDLKEVLCPYWIKTDYGTVRCNFLDVEVVDEEDEEAKEKIVQWFGTEKAINRFGESWALPDESKSVVFAKMKMIRMMPDERLPALRPHRRAHHAPSPDPAPHASLETHPQAL